MTDQTPLFPPPAGTDPVPGQPSPAPVQEPAVSGEPVAVPVALDTPAEPIAAAMPAPAPAAPPLPASGDPRRVIAWRALFFLYGILLMAGCAWLVVQGVATEVRTETLRLSFADFGYRRLVTIDRTVPRSPAPLAKLERVVRELLGGPVSNDTLPVLPQDARLLGCWIRGAVAYVDLSRQAVAGLADAADAEILAVYALVHSICANVPGIERVQLLVEHVPVPTWRGLTRTLTPLRPRPDLAGGERRGS